MQIKYNPLTGNHSLYLYTAYADVEFDMTDEQLRILQELLYSYIQEEL